MAVGIKVIACALLLVPAFAIRPGEKTAQFWHAVSQQELKTALQLQKMNTNVAKNVILFIGDGMGVSTVTASRILKGQLQGEDGESSSLEFEKFPFLGLSKTYAVDKQTPDSASTATAFVGGVKTNDYTIGLTAAAQLGNCSSSLPADRQVISAVEDAYNNGKSTGIVTTTRINHATPAAAYAHTPHRNWYGDADLSEEAKQNGCKDIAHQFFEKSKMFTVVLGGGRKYFQPNTTFDPEYPDLSNKRQDGQDLIAKWEANQMADNLNSKYVWNKEEFDGVDPTSTDRLLGMFEPGDMKYEAHRREENGTGEPSLAEMTEKSIKMLSKNPNGYFLYIEAGRIDHAHHDSVPYLSFYDTLALDDAVRKAVEMTSESDTLIIVTADHGHVMTMGGYSDRGNPILGLAPSNGNPEIAQDGKTYTTITYGNGPGFQGGNNTDTCQNRPNLTHVETESPTYVPQSAVPLEYETHSGEEVAIYARGPMAHLFHGTHEQNYIARVIRYVTCTGEDKSHCEGKSTDYINTEFLGLSLNAEQARVGLYVQFALLLLFAVILLVIGAVLCLRR